MCAREARDRSRPARKKTEWRGSRQRSTYRRWRFIDRATGCVRSKAMRTTFLARGWRCRDIAVAVGELLYRAGRRLMKLGQMPDQLKARAELVVERVRVIAHDVEPAALARAFGAERGDDDVASRLDGVRHLTDICSAVVDSREEVKDRAIVPHIVRMPRKREGGHVPADPLDVVRLFAQPFPRNGKRDRG